MSITAFTADTVDDPREFASRKVIGVLGVPADDVDTIGYWIAAYRAAAVDGVRSAEVATKITRHLHRFRDWFTDGYGHDRIAAAPRGRRLARVPDRHRPIPHCRGRPVDPA